MVVRQLSSRNLTEDDTEGEHVRWEVELIAEQDLRGHVRVGAAEGEPTELLLVAGSDASKTKVGDLDSAISGNKEVLAFQIAVDAFPSMEVGQSASDVGGERQSQSPGEGFLFIVNVDANVAPFNELGYDEDAVVRGRCTAETDEETDVGVPALLHQAPFAFKVLGDVVFGGGKNLLNGDIDAQISTFVDVPKRARAELLPVTFDVIVGNHVKGIGVHGGRSWRGRGGG